MSKDTQVITIGNAFELVCRHVEAYSGLEDLARVDERHFGQKAAFWSTQHGLPTIVICTAAPSHTVLDATYDDQPQPIFIEPIRSSSSICHDVLADANARSRLLSVLDRRKGVFLAPYVHTAHVESLATFLLNSGYTLLDYHCQAELVKLLWNKVNAQQVVFTSVDLLNRHRPNAIVAESENDLLVTISQFARQGTKKVVVKSAAAVGGAGVFFVDTLSVVQGAPPQTFLCSLGQNEVDRSAPFLVEEWVEWDVSPTVDIEVTGRGQVVVEGVAIQRLYDRRYYAGFYSSPSLEARWWFRSVEALARSVGRRLANIGYIGPANVDFVVCSSERRITLIEVNPRRSALIDGFSLRKMKYGSAPGTSISVADYVNVSGHFVSLENAFSSCALTKKASAAIFPIADGGFSSNFRWAGVCAVGLGSLDSEDILEESALHLQDPARDEIGLAEPKRRSFGRISERPVSCPPRSHETSKVDTAIS